jgi:hypothetical protein
LASTYRIAQIIIRNIQWPFIACRLRRSVYFNVPNCILHSLWSSERTATPKHKITHSLFCVCNWNAECLL